jgi:HK97 family phage prohead protease
MKQIKYKSVQAKFTENNGAVEGYASIFDHIDLAGDIVARSAFTKTLKQRRVAVRFLWQHIPQAPIGVIEEIRVDEKGLWFRARFDDTTAGQDARKSLLNGSTDSFSIGYRPISWKHETVGEREIIRLTEVALLEISLVTFACNELALATSVKAAAAGEEMDPERLKLLTRFAEFLMEEQRSGPNEDENAPETPAEGETDEESAQDAAEDEDAADDASEGQDDKDAEDEGEDEPETTEEDEDELDEDAKKALADLALSFKLDALLAQLRT